MSESTKIEPGPITIKIISNGHAFDTRISDEVTGRDIINVTKIEWEVDANSERDEGFAKCILHLVHVPVEIITKAVAEEEEEGDKGSVIS